MAKPHKFDADAENSGRYTCAVEGQESVQSHPVFLDVQCELTNETNMCYNKLILNFWVILCT